MSSACFTSSKTLQTHLYHQSKLQFCGVAAIAPWFCLRLPSCSPGFESQAGHLCFFQFELLQFIFGIRKLQKFRKKRPGLAPYLKKHWQLSKFKNHIRIFQVLVSVLRTRQPRPIRRPRPHFLLHLLDPAAGLEQRWMVRARRKVAFVLRHSHLCHRGNLGGEQSDQMLN